MRLELGILDRGERLLLVPRVTGAATGDGRIVGRHGAGRGWVGEVVGGAEFASVDAVEALVLQHEGRFRDVELDLASLRRPGTAVPQTGLNRHGSERRVWHSCFVVMHSDHRIVHVPSGKKKQQKLCHHSSFAPESLLTYRIATAETDVLWTLDVVPLSLM